MTNDPEPARIYVNAPNHSGKSGSMEHFATMLAHAYVRHGYEVVFCSSRRSDVNGTQALHIPDSLTTAINRLNMLLLYGAILLDIVWRRRRDFAIANISQEFIFPAFLRKSLVIVHDTIQLEFPRSRAIGWLLAINWRLARHAGKRICVSHATKADLAGMKIDAEALYVPFDSTASTRVAVPSPGRASALPDARTTDAVWCGTLAVHKDFATFLDLARRNPNLRLCAIVPEADAAVLAASSLPDNLTILHSLAREDYERQLRSSGVLVSTSRKEGYGMPPMEALMQGVPILLSDIPVYREIYGDVAEFFPVRDAEALGLRIHAMLNRHTDAAAAFAILDKYRGRIDDYIRGTDRLIET